MEFWAKSQGKSITDKDISRRTDNVRRLKELLGNELEPDEWKAVESELNDIISRNGEAPVTLKNIWKMSQNVRKIFRYIWQVFYGKGKEADS